MKIFKVKTIDDHPHYVAARSALHKEDLVKFKKLKKNPELSQEEKKVLQARDYIQQQSWEQALTYLENMGIIKSEYLNAEMYAIKTYLFQILARPEEALWSNQRALFYYELCGDQEGLFRSHYNRSVTLEKFQQFKLMDFHYKEARKYTHSPHQIVHLLKAEAFVHCRLGQVDKALESIQEALFYGKDLEKSHFDNLRTVASEIYIKTGQINKAIELLRDLMASKINPERARVLAELKMLEALLDDTILKKPAATIEKNQEWALKWHTLSALQIGEEERAKSLWKKLSKKYPLLYGGDFMILDPLEETTAFGLLLKKIYQRKAYSHAPQKNLSKVDHLIWLLTNATIPQRKEDLIESIWGEDYEPSYDARFYKLVQRVKKNQGIENVGGTYFIKSQKKQSA
ncbi:MAG: hypothetical protein K9K67_09795 [Bacteriovoracaceae bacterium]|nr:hypothetical protein [Bacteriovoracaceae bacterium]